MSFESKLRSIFNMNQVLINNLENYSIDRSPGISANPDYVVIAHNKEDVRRLCLLVSEYKVPLTIRAAGSGTTGGALAINGGVVLSVEKLNRIKEVDIVNKMMVVEPGVITGDIHKEAESKGLFYPPDPQSMDYCTIGGNVSENAGGPRALKYGVTGHYVVGLKGYYIDGTPFSLGGKQLKNVAGYNLIQLLVGSEGTLGIITEITLKLRSKPNITKDMIILFDNYESAVRTLTKIQTHAIEPSTVEFIDGYCFKAVAKYLKTTVPYQTASASLLIECDGYDERSVQDQLLQIKSLAESEMATHIDLLETKEKKDFAWDCRKNFSLALTDTSLYKKSEDVVVPPSKIPKYLKDIKNIGDSLGLKILGYGHLGDGNIHVNILGLMHTDNWQKLSKEAVSKIMEAAVNCGGTISGEHGIGCTKKDYMPLVFSKKDLEIMKSIKSVLDPHNLLNPGKLFVSD